MKSSIIIVLSILVAICHAGIPTDTCPGPKGKHIPSSGLCNAKRQSQLALDENKKAEKDYWLPECYGEEEGSEYKRIQQRPNAKFKQFCVDFDTGCEIFWNAPQPTKAGQQINCECMAEQFRFQNPKLFNARDAIDPKCDVKTGDYTRGRLQYHGMGPQTCIGPHGETMKSKQKNAIDPLAPKEWCANCEFCPKGIDKC